MRSWKSALVAAVLLLAAGLALAACGPKEESKTTSQYVDTSTASASSPTAEAPGSGTPVKLFEVGNVYGVRTGATAPSFTLGTAATITEISDYHYILGGGPTPGTIGLKSAAGLMYGPWPCTGFDGQGGVKNATWTAKPNVSIPAGTYTIVDSGPSTWSTNDQASSLGFTTVMGEPEPEGAGQP
jgi:hypothetical protein